MNNTDSISNDVFGKIFGQRYTDSLECKGVFGKIFGHCYEPRYSTEEKVTGFREWIDSSGSGFKINGGLIDLVSLADTLKCKKRTYIADVCRRCGHKKVDLKGNNKNEI